MRCGLRVWFLRFGVVFGWVCWFLLGADYGYLFFSFSSSVSSCWISSIGLGGGVVAMVHPIHAPIARMAVKAMNTGMATSQSLMASRAGQRSATVYEIATAKQTRQISQPIPWSLLTICFTSDRVYRTMTVSRMPMYFARGLGRTCLSNSKSWLFARAHKRPAHHSRQLEKNC